MDIIPVEPNTFNLLYWEKNKKEPERSPVLFFIIDDEAILPDGTKNVLFVPLSMSGAEKKTELGFSVIEAIKEPEYKKYQCPGVCFFADIEEAEAFYKLYEIA